jgi:hypothetical protein
MQIIKVVGLSKADNGRQCSQHECCGLRLRVGDVVGLCRGVTVDVTNVEKTYKAIFALKVRNSLQYMFILGYMQMWVTGRAILQSTR